MRKSTRIERPYSVMEKGRPETARTIWAISPEKARLQYLSEVRAEGRTVLWCDTRTDRGYLIGAKP